MVRDLLLTDGVWAPSERIRWVSSVSWPREARWLAEQAARFDAHTLGEGKAFAKPIPHAELEREKELFCELVTRPKVFEALSDFVSRDDPYTYLP